MLPFAVEVGVGGSGQLVVHRPAHDRRIGGFATDVGEHGVDAGIGDSEFVSGGTFGGLAAGQSFDHRNPLLRIRIGGAGGALPVAPEVAFGQVPHPGVGNPQNLARLTLLELAAVDLGQDGELVIVGLVGLYKRQHFEDKDTGNKIANKLAGMIETQTVKQRTYELTSAPMLNKIAKRADDLMDRATPRWGGGRIGNIISDLKKSTAFYDAVLNQKDFDAATKYLGSRYTQHNQAPRTDRKASRASLPS